MDQLFAMLARYVRILRDLAEMPLDEYQADPRNFGSAERFLQLVIETALSVGHHIIASAGFDQPTTYAEVFRTWVRKMCSMLSSRPESSRWLVCGIGSFTIMRISSRRACMS